MIIGIDLDGCAGDYTGALRKFVGDALGIPENERMDVFPVPADYNFSNWKYVATEFVKHHSEAVTAGIYAEMDMIPKASETLWKLDHDGHHMRVITSRFVKKRQHARVITSTAEWLDKNDIPYHDIMFVQRKMDVFADVNIDDSPENIINFQKAGRNYIIFDQPYNQHLEGPRAYNWDDVYAYISTLPNQ
jgi:5'-nucleotidase